MQFNHCHVVYYYYRQLNNQIGGGMLFQCTPTTFPTLSLGHILPPPYYICACYLLPGVKERRKTEDALFQSNDCCGNNDDIYWIGVACCCSLLAIQSISFLRG